MRVPPLTIGVRVVKESRTKFKMWFPLFLLWPLLLALLLPVLLVTLVVDAVCLLAGARRTYTRFVLTAFEVLAAMRDMDIYVENPNQVVALTFH